MTSITLTTLRWSGFRDRRRPGKAIEPAFPDAAPLDLASPKTCKIWTNCGRLFGASWPGAEDVAWIFSAAEPCDSEKYRRQGQPAYCPSRKKRSCLCVGLSAKYTGSNDSYALRAAYSERLKPGALLYVGAGRPEMPSLLRRRFKCRSSRETLSLGAIKPETCAIGMTELVRS